MSTHNLPLLRETLEAYEQLTGQGQALNASQARQRDELLQKLTQITGATKKVVSAARRMVNGTVPGQLKSRATRHQGSAAAGPRDTSPRRPNALRVTQVLPTRMGN